MRVAPVTSPDMSGLVIGYTSVVKTRISSSEPPVSSLKNNSSAPKAKIPVGSDPESNPICSPIQFKRSDPVFVDGQ